MGNLTINNGGIIINSDTLPNVDLRYGPYNSIEDANIALNGHKIPGLTVGIKQAGGIIKEYWYQYENGILTLTPTITNEGTTTGINVAGTEITPDTNGTITLPIDTTPKDGSTNIITSGAVYSGLGGKQDNIQDLNQIRSNATTAIQPETLASTLGDIEISRTEQYDIAANLTNRTADIDQQTSEVKALGYKVLDPSLSFAEQVTESNTTYEIRSEFDLDSKVEGSITLDTTANFVFDTANVSYNISTQTLILAPNQCIEVPAFAHVVDDAKTILHPHLWRNTSQESVTVYVASILGSATLPYTIYNVVSIPDNCELKFNGGRLIGGYLDLNGANLTGDIKLYSEPARNIENETDEGYKPSNNYLHVSWFGAVGDGITDDAPALRRTVAWTHKKGATIEFSKGLTYMMGDGIIDTVNDPFKIKHTGYTYDGTNIYNGTSIVPNSYIKQHPNNIGREITLILFKYNSLSIIGNGSTLLSNPSNGICRHNMLFVMVGCESCDVRDLTFNGNSFNRMQDGMQYLCTDGKKYQSTYISPTTDIRPYDSFYYAFNVRNRGNYAGIQWGELQYCADYGTVDNALVAHCKKLTFKNVNFIKSVRSTIAIKGSSYDRELAELLFENCKFEYALYHVVLVPAVKGAKFDNCTVKYGGLNEDLTDSPFMYNTHTTLDMESDYRREDCMIENISFISCIFGESSSIGNDNHVILNIDAQNILFDGCFFDNVGLVTVPCVNGRYNEVSRCIFNGFVPDLRQEGVYWHDNVIKVEVNISAFNAFSVDATYDDSFTYGFLYKNTVTINTPTLYDQVGDDAAPNFTTDTYYKKKDDVYTLLDTAPDNWQTNWFDYYTRRDFVFKSWADGNTKNPRYLPLYDTNLYYLTDGTNDYISDATGSVVIDEKKISSITKTQGSPHIASLVPTRFENNTVILDYNENIEQRQFARINTNGNLIFKNNIFYNFYTIIGYSALSIQVNSFIGNIFKYDILKYPWIKDVTYRAHIRIFGPLDQNKCIKGNAGIRFYVGENIDASSPYYNDKDTIIMSGGKRYDGYQAVSRRGAEFPTLTTAGNQGLPFYRTDLEKQIYARESVTQFGTDTNLGTNANKNIFVQNNCNSDIITTFILKQIDPNTIAKIRFCKSNNSIEDSIDYNIVSIIKKGSYYWGYTDSFVSPDKTVYPYINIEYRYAGGNYKFFSIRTHSYTWFEADGLPPVLRRGTTAQRPTSELTAADAGLPYYDTTLNKPIYWNGTIWTDANGEVLELTVSDTTVLIGAAVNSTASVNVYYAGSIAPTIDVLNPDNTANNWLIATLTGNTLALTLDGTNGANTTTSPRGAKILITLGTEVVIINVVQAAGSSN